MIINVKDKQVLIDDEDYEKISPYKWRIFKSRGTHLYVVSDRTENKIRHRIYLHRLLTDCPSDKIVDHINGNPLDNRKENLRICNHNQNMLNQKPRKGTKWSEYKGVYKVIKNDRYEYWVARCNLNGKRLFKNCKTEKEAALAYNEMAKELFGEFAYLNEVEE